MSEGDTIQHEEKINKISKIVLVFAAFVIVILGAGIVAMEIAKNERDTQQDTENGDVSYYGEDIEAMIEDYQDRIDNAETNDLRGDLLLSRIMDLNSYCGENCKEQILSDLEAYWNIGNENNDAMLCDYAVEYDGSSLADLYCGRLNSSTVGDGDGGLNKVDG